MMTVALAARIARHTRDNGGCTFDREGNIIDFDHGYVVSERDGLEVLGCTLGSQIMGRVVRFVLDNPDADLFGTWLDGETLYVDVNRHYSNRSDAVRVGYQHNQLAVWDCANGCEIRLTRDYGYTIDPNRYGDYIVWRSYVTFDGEVRWDLRVRSRYFQSDADKEAIRDLFTPSDRAALDNGWPITVLDDSIIGSQLSDYFETDS